ncbi:hypothetical protein GTP38_18295 [Duganella sp. FT94W]|uniref:Uncharacterized protein n=1 Tax=Duganella lactea TaxID=2692173 RepID=A0ABW9VBB2_9BURK|nr:hypothetical protein [Duganella lactea]MYM36286.1 hypothetical protein [Duganella lactea]
MTTPTSPTQDTCPLDRQFRMTHTFHLLLRADEPAAAQLESTLTNARARIDKWLILRCGGGYSHSITVDGIGEASARALRKALANLGNGVRVHVEHMLHFDRTAKAA